MLEDEAETAFHKHPGVRWGLCESKRAIVGEGTTYYLFLRHEPGVQAEGGILSHSRRRAAPKGPGGRVSAPEQGAGESGR